MPKNNLKIGLVFDDSLDRNDGVQQYVKLLGSWLGQNGHDVKYLVGQTTKAPHSIQADVISLSKNIGVSANKNKLTIPLPAGSKKIRQTLKQENFDILHVQIPYSPFMSGKIIKNANLSTGIIGTFHIVGSTFFEKYGSWMLSVSQLKTLKKFDRFLAVSTAAEEFASSYYHTKIDQIVPNMVNVDKFKGARVAKKSDKFNITFLGRLVERKGCKYLLDAISELPDQVKEKINVVVCGDGPQRESLTSQAEHLGIGKIVEFKGYIEEDEKPNILATADLAVFPSYEGESFGIVLIEAMASGKCVVLGGDNVGYRTVMAQKSKELIVDVFDKREFARRISSLVEDEPLREKLVSWQNARVKDFDVDYVGPIILENYYQILNLKHS